MKIIPVPAFEDNYIWLICDERYAAVVDPGDAEPVLDYLGRHGLSLAAILITHHHGDHTGGIEALLEHAAVPVYGPRKESIPGISNPVGEGDTVRLPDLGVEFAVLDVPGHTAGHIAYYGANSLFCGDTLFTCGCGKLFEGTPLQMYASLQKFAALPDDTQVYCAHEYTLENIRFAKKVEPANRQLLEREARDIQTREQGRPTLPSTLALEKATNPFLRCEHPAVIEAAVHFSGSPLDNAVMVFTAIREWRNRF
ncbi:hydroxyacylglutathione hydrolase [Sulfuricella denitrificans skB26]|uniref:Hydroxyacylglutathione hydrolase n=1 Tax=Sulfuricella denitrificans (strain DSM 22764 / NBRC 105220 / skB26) TaxID=1163617 RepID=S6AK75_SULDS|nr:hydroxyacylglutathione hydrolase [Sulfuricella denitrificans skB26]